MLKYNLKIFIKVVDIVTSQVILYSYTNKGGNTMTPRQKQMKFRANIKEFAVDFAISVTLLGIISVFLFQFM